MEKRSYQPPLDGRDLYFRFEMFDANDVVEPHQHAFGQLLYCTSGVMEITSGDRHFMSPPQYAVWIPAGAVHSATIRQRADYQSAYIAASHCVDLPRIPCVLAIGTLVKTILSDFASRQLISLNAPKDLRLGQVLIDQLEDTQVLNSYLPSSDDALLSRLLDKLNQDPGSNKTLGQWADILHVTERTLARKFIRDLGMTFGEWRRRARFLSAVLQLKKGLAIETIGLNLGYSTSSAFIAMFRRECGSTPEQFRRSFV